MRPSTTTPLPYRPRPACPVPYSRSPRLVRYDAPREDPAVRAARERYFAELSARVLSLEPPRDLAGRASCAVALAAVLCGIVWVEVLLFAMVWHAVTR